MAGRYRQAEAGKEGRWLEVQTCRKARDRWRQVLRLKSPHNQAEGTIGSQRQATSRQTCSTVRGYHKVLCMGIYMLVCILYKNNNANSFSWVNIAKVYLYIITCMY